MKGNLVDRYLHAEAKRNGFGVISSEETAEIKAAKAIITLLCEANMTIEAATSILNLCKEALQFTTLAVQADR